MSRLIQTGTLALVWPQKIADSFDNIVINNGYICPGGKIKYIGDGRFSNITLLLNTIDEIEDYKNLYGNTIVKYRIKYGDTTIKNKYCLIGIIQCQEGDAHKIGHCKFRFLASNGQNGEFHMYTRFDQTTVEFTPLDYYGSSTEHLYYKKENGFIYIYSLCPTESYIDYSIEADSYGTGGYITAIDLSKVNIRINNQWSQIREVLNSTDGLTEITWGKRLDAPLTE